jgi:phosphatidylglycerophosphatase A
MVTIILFYFFHAIKFQFIGIQNVNPQLFYLPLIFFSISLIAAYYSGFTYIKSYPALAEQTLTKVISTFCYAGYFPFASGTFTSLLILIFYLFFPPDIIMHLILFIIVAIMGLYFSGRFENRMLVKDPSYIVIDEVSGMILALLPVTLIPYVSGILFSFFPWLKDLKVSIFNFTSIANFSFRGLSDIRSFTDFIFADNVLFIILSIMQFVLFRIFDIFKPLGIRSLQSIKAGPGIMIDDLIAGLYSIAAGFIIFVLLFIGLRL